MDDPIYSEREGASEVKRRYVSVVPDVVHLIVSITLQTRSESFMLSVSLQVFRNFHDSNGRH